MEIISKKKNNSMFLCVRDSFTHNVIVHVHVWSVFTHELMRCRHTVERKDRERQRDVYVYVYVYVYVKCYM